MYLSNICSFLAVLGATVPYVFASVAITAPLMSSWKAGTTNIITWTDNGDGKPMPAKFDIALMEGKMTSLQLVASVVSQVDSSAGQYSWNIPANQAPAKDYSIRIGTPPDVAYSPYFEIVGANGAQGGGAAPDSSAPAGTSTAPNQVTEAHSNGGNTPSATNAGSTGTPTQRNGAVLNSALQLSNVVLAAYIASRFM
ncbi:hypothetical protein K493DRAFT_370912 [Basidiobolus meristosporus CBS 931.73]|uniref:Yeast cell wall synthesis Kre9/Knh1-like N-terminal domain-containing protein n=1 Tax=Basidiobolus meristosporus CBS 931.73 TaxID=1314790 RepID=A0A1Y1YEZ0_9FUNG|nr:hypothetical protein K493DRAFT_370912 [Basidiobolus meristosporus CBS 931.73]|eukprot:ORX96535.1 hypothetical protein K493DRAFT_370912 [Basidiobolus meristosporus CBS 931.73]